MKKAIEILILSLVVLVPVLIYTGTANANLIKVAVFNLGMLALLGLWVIESTSEGRVMWTKSAMHLPVACYLGWNLISTLMSHYRWISVNELGKVLSYLFLYYIVTIYVTNRVKMNRLLIAIFTGCLVTCIYGMLQHCGIDWINWYPKEVRILSSFGNPTFFAGYLALLFPVAVNICLAKPSRVLQYVVGGLSGLILMCLLFTYTRAAWLGVMAGMVADAILIVGFMGLQRLIAEKVWRSAAILAVMLLILMLIASHDSIKQFNVQQRFASSFETNDASNKQRMTHWKGALSIFRHHMITGAGLGTYLIYIPQHQPNRSYATGTTVIVDHAHNDLLETAADTGIIGLAIFLWMAGTCIYMVINTIRKLKDHYWSYLSAGLLCGMIAFMGQNMAGVSMRWVFGGMFFWLFAGLIVVSERIGVSGEDDEFMSAKHSKPTRSTEWLPTAYAFAIITVLMGSYLIGLTFLSEIHQKQGNLAVDDGKWEVARKELETAITLNKYSLGSYYKIGHVYNTLGRFDLALAAFNQLGALCPNYARLQYNTGAIYTNLGRYEDAAKEYRRAIVLEDSALNHIALAETYAVIGQKEIARKEADASLRVLNEVGASIGGEPAEIYVRCGKLYADLGDEQQAFKHFLYVVKNHPTYKLGHFYLANCYRKQNRTADAVKEYRQALSLDDSDPRTSVNLAAAFIGTESYLEATSACRTALKANPNDAYAHFNLGLIHLKTQQLPAARAELSAAAGIGGRSLVGAQANYALALLPGRVQP